MNITHYCLLAVYIVSSASALSQGIVLKMTDGTIRFFRGNEIQEIAYTSSESDTPEEALARARSKRQRSILNDDCIQLKRALYDFLRVNDGILPKSLSEIVNFEGTQYPLSLRYFRPPQTLDRKEGDEENKKLIEKRFILLTPGKPAPSSKLGLDSTKAEQQHAKTVFSIVTNPDFVDGKFVMAMNGLGAMLPFDNYTEIPGIEAHLEVIEEARKRAEQAVPPKSDRAGG